MSAAFASPALEARCVNGAASLMPQSTRTCLRHVPTGVLVAGLGAFSMFLAGCAQNPSSSGSRTRSTEYFPASKYGAASPRVVTEGRAVPRGGGRRLVGRPYTVAGKRYVPRPVSAGYTVSGTASWYGAAFHGRRTANGEVYDMRALSAAHPTMPLPSYARVTNTRNGHSVIVRVNDRGPFHGGRVLDVSQKVAEALDFRRAGTGRVKVDYIGPAGLAGSDDNVLMASLRTDGRPATLNGPTSAPATMIAQAEQETPRASRESTPQTVASIATSSAPKPAKETIVAAATPSPSLRSGLGNSQSSANARFVSNGAVVASFASTAYAPAPPPRPLDLATIPGADTPIGASRRRALQPMFFAEPSPVASALIRRGPFDNVNLDGLQPLR